MKKQTPKEPKAVADKKPEANNYIIPPGLHMPFVEFLGHFEVAGDLPIMIVGETGVGKSIFLHIYEKLYEEKYTAKNTKPKIITENCASFGDKNSDPLIAHSELFGCLKGVHSLAVKDKKGLIEEADGGVLILDEIGELPKSIQGLLFRFLETGVYRSLGDIKPKTANVRVVGATNNVHKLLPAFQSRFLPFYIPPLHMRRQDVLYYMNEKFPELIKTLKGKEVLALLAYNWPGNVREIDRIARLMRRFEISSELSGFIDVEDDEFYLDRLHFLDHRYAGIDVYDINYAMKWVSSWGGDKFLLSQLKEYGLNPPDLEWEGPFGVFDEDYNIISTISVSDIDDEARKLSDSYGVKIIQRIEAFNRAYYGFYAFCRLFGKHEAEGENLLKMKNLKGGYLGFFEWDYQNANKIRLLQSENPTEIPEDLNLFLTRLEKLEDPDKPKDVALPRNYIDVYGKTRDQVLKSYYEYLLTTTGGIEMRASALAGVPNSTFRGQCKKLGVSPPEK